MERKYFTEKRTPNEVTIILTIFRLYKTPGIMAKPSPQPIDPSTVPSRAREIVNKVRFPMLATMDGNQPRVRPVSPVRTDGFVVYIANLKSYGKTREIEANHQVELCYLDDDHNQVRITGEAEIVNDRKLLEDIWNANRLLQHYLGSVDNPELVVYKIKPVRVRFMLEWALNYYEVPLQ
jgi:general stress protein 26